MLRAYNERFQAQDNKDSAQNLNYTTTEESHPEERTLCCISLRIFDLTIHEFIICQVCDTEQTVRGY